MENTKSIQQKALAVYEVYKALYRDGADFEGWEVFESKDADEYTLLAAWGESAIEEEYSNL